MGEAPFGPFRQKVAGTFFRACFFIGAFHAACLSTSAFTPFCLDIFRIFWTSFSGAQQFAQRCRNRSDSAEPCRPPVRPCPVRRHRKTRGTHGPVTARRHTGAGQPKSLPRRSRLGGTSLSEAKGVACSGHAHHYVLGVPRMNNPASSAVWVVVFLHAPHGVVGGFFGAPPRSGAGGAENRNGHSTPPGGPPSRPEIGHLPLGLGVRVQGWAACLHRRSRGRHVLPRACSPDAARRESMPPGLTSLHLPPPKTKGI